MTIIENLLDSSNQRNFYMYWIRASAYSIFETLTLDWGWFFNHYCISLYKFFTAIPVPHISSISISFKESPKETEFSMPVLTI